MQLLCLHGSFLLTVELLCLALTRTIAEKLNCKQQKTPTVSKKALPPSLIFFMLVLKGIWGGLLRMASEKKNNFSGERYWERNFSPKFI